MTIKIATTVLISLFLVSPTICFAVKPSSDLRDVEPAVRLVSPVSSITGQVQLRKEEVGLVVPWPREGGFWGGRNARNIHIQEDVELSEKSRCFLRPVQRSVSSVEKKIAVGLRFSTKAFKNYRYAVTDLWMRSRGLDPESMR